MKLSLAQIALIKYLQDGNELYVWRNTSCNYVVGGFTNIKKSTIHSLEKKSLVCRDTSTKGHDIYYILTEAGKLINSI